MGGGKGDVSYYVSPIKAGRIIFELGGKCEYDEVYWFLSAVRTIVQGSFIKLLICVFSFCLVGSKYAFQSSCCESRNVGT